MIAGTRSGVGKTTISSAVMSAMNKKYGNIAPFKSGPDYIDPRFHEFMTGNPSYNLDIFMLGEEAVKYSFYENSINKNISIVEGVMGLYDGLGHSLDNYSSAHVARMLDIPVILVVNGKGLSTSIAAEIKGYVELDKNVEIAGVIINNVSSEKLYNILKEAIETYTGVECLGYFPVDKTIKLESRHLGLKQAAELEDMKNRVDKLAEMAEKYIDLDRIYKLSKTDNKYEYKNIFSSINGKLKYKRVAVATDKAFSFYYNINLDLLKNSGAEIIYFSPLNDKELPDKIDTLYLGGGYPENYAKELYSNKTMINSIKNFVKSNKKVYAECGGFIYLTNGIKQVNGEFNQLCGILDIDIEMKSRLNIRRFGYIEIQTEDNIEIKAHEFHYSGIMNSNENKCYFNINKVSNGNKWKCGYVKQNVIAGYPHVNFLGNLDFFKRIFA